MPSNPKEIHETEAGIEFKKGLAALCRQADGEVPFEEGLAIVSEMAGMMAVMASEMGFDGARIADDGLKTGAIIYLMQQDGKPS